MVLSQQACSKSFAPVVRLFEFVIPHLHHPSTGAFLQTMKTPKRKNSMLVAKIKLHLSKDQTVIKEGVTPAEAAFYVAEHNKNAGKCPVEVIDEPKEVERSSSEEIQRLYQRFPQNKIKMLYQSPLSNIPETFEQAFGIGGSMTFPTGKLMEMDVSKI